MTTTLSSGERAIPQSVVVVALGTTQTLAWASSYYLPAILADDMAVATGVSRSWVFAVFSASLLLAAALGPAVGRRIDQRGGSGVLVASNVLLAVGLVGLSLCGGIVSLATAWTVLGVGMSLGLYDAAFATLAGIYGRQARIPITGITLIAGFASTVGWPLSALLDASVGWRGTCATWAAMHLVIGLPLNLLLVPRHSDKHPDDTQHGQARWQPRKEMILLAYVFAASWFVTGAMAAHLPVLLERMGATTVQAVAAAALIGPAQVAARLAEFLVMRRSHPLVSARLATLMHPIGAAAIAALGTPVAALFGLLHGAGNGLLTIARGTVPLALFGPDGYGARTGLLGAPARAAQAAAPLLFGLLLDANGPKVLLVSSGLSLSAFAALLLLKRTSASEL
ncbi:MAG: MFS transporter [Bradyrhizobiaceae bacterium]|nr:MFS transporter [Bradyrhizobiaceae bacterium]